MHLDGSGSKIEMVTNPLTKTELVQALALFARFMKTSGKKDTEVKELLFNGVDFARTLSIEDAQATPDGARALDILENRMAYCYLESQFKVQGGATEIVAVDGIVSTIAPRAAQLTTSMTLAQINSNSATKVKIGGRSQSLANDAAMKDYLMGFEYDEALAKPKSILVKHAAEQLCSIVLMDTPTGAEAFTKKLKNGHGWHSQANKIVPLMERGGETAYMVEFRGHSELQSDSIEYGIWRFFHDQNTVQLTDLLNEKFGG